MCGIAGVIYKDRSGDIGRDMTSMLQAMKHRGPDSTGYALYGQPGELLVMRFKLADPNADADFNYSDRLARGRREVESRLAKIGATVDRVNRESEYAYRATFRYVGELKPLVDYVEDVPGAEVLSLGHSLEIIKDLGDAEAVSNLYRLQGFSGTHGIGHVRMATESDVDIAGAHPYWAYPFNDVAEPARYFSSIYLTNRYRRVTVCELPYHRRTPDLDHTGVLADDRRGRCAFIGLWRWWSRCRRLHGLTKRCGNPCSNESW